jgi:hypothetical protein
LIFTGQAGEQSIEARYEDETIWLTQQLMAELFQMYSLPKTTWRKMSWSHWDASSTLIWIWPKSVQNGKSQ